MPDPTLDRFLDCSRERRLRLLVIPHCGDKDPCFACLTAEKMLDAALRNEYDRGRQDAIREIAEGGNGEK